MVAAIEGRDRLKAEVAEGERSLKLRFQEHPGSVPMDVSPARQSNLMVELEQMQMRVAQVQVQNEELMSSPKRQAVRRFCSSLRQGRHDVDGGNVHELARLWQVVAGVAEGLSQISHSSMVANAVRKCIGSVTGRHCVQVRSRFGLRGVRVGEASNPGPMKRRRRDVQPRSVGQ